MRDDPETIQRIDALERRVAEICGQLNVLHAQLVDCVADAVSGELWQQFGIHSPAHWLAWQAGLTAGHARRLVAVAEARDERPTLSAAFAAGELSLDQVSLAVRAPAWTDAQICELAKLTTTAQLGRLVRSYQFPDTTADDERDDTPNGTIPDPTADTDDTTPDAGGDDRDDAGGVEPEWVRGVFGDDGRYRLQADVDADTGHLIDTALHHAHDQLLRAGHRDVTWVDALRHIAQRSLHHPDTGGDPGRGRYRINLHLDPTTRYGAWGDGWNLPDAIRRHLTCDGLLSPTFTAEGVPVSVGRSHHIVADRTRRHVEHRDRGCRAPGCTHTRWTEVHHIVHWQDGGPTDTANLVSLCPWHHRAHHRGQFHITGNPDAAPDHPDHLVFTDTHGRIIHPAAHPQPPTRPPPTPKHPYRHPLGEHLDYDAVYFNPPRPATVALD